MSCWHMMKASENFMVKSGRFCSRHLSHQGSGLGLKQRKRPRRMGKEEVEECEGRSVTGTYEVLGVSQVVTEGARGQIHNFRDVPKIMKKMEMTRKTRFDRYLEEHLEDLAFAERFKKAGEAWDAVFQRTKDKDLQKAIQEVMSNVKT